MLAGAAVMFLLASAIVAFRGWPQVGSQPAPIAVSVSRASLATPSRTQRLLVAAALHANSGAVPAGTPRTAAGGGTNAGGGGTTQPPGGGTGSNGSTPPGGSTGRGVPVVSVPPTLPNVTPPPIVTSTGGTVAQVVSSTGQTVGSTAGGVAKSVASGLSGSSPSAANAVSSVGTTAQNTITSTSNTAAGAVGSLTGGH